MIERFLEKSRKLYIAFMDLEKAYDRVDRTALWKVLEIYGVGGRLLQAVKSFYENSRACVKIKGEVSELFEIKVGVRQGCVMSPWMFNVYMDGVVREVKEVFGEGGVYMNVNGNSYNITSMSFADDTGYLECQKWRYNG